MERIGARADELIFGLIEERRGEQAGGEESGGEDVLSLLLGARDEDGQPMTPAELRDELVTALVAGHETTASQLAWAFERLAREPRVQSRLHAELDEDADETYLTATVNEILRRRAVLPNAEPRLVKQPVEIGGIRYEPGVVLFASAYLVHHDPVDLPRPLRLPPRALPRAAARHLHLDPLRRRSPSLHRRELRAARDEARAARRAAALRAATRERDARGDSPARDRLQPISRKPRDPDQPNRRPSARSGARRGRADPGLTRTPPATR